MQAQNPPSIVIRAALAGNLFDKSKNPNIPFGEDEVIASAVECVKAGASELHIHLRDKTTGDPVFAPARYNRLREGITKKLQAEFPHESKMWQPVISFTTTQKGLEKDPFFIDSGNPDPITHPSEFAELRGRTILARPDFAPITDPSNKVLDRDLGEVPYHAAYTQAKALIDMAKHHEVTPECEIQHPYFVNLIEALLHDGTLLDHPRIQTLFGHTDMPPEKMVEHIDDINTRLQPRSLILGVRFARGTEGRPALIIPEMLNEGLDLALQHRPDGKQKITGIRVGLEDNFGIAGKEPAETTNADMVKMVVELAHEKGLKVLNPAEARKFTGMERKLTAEPIRHSGSGRLRHQDGMIEDASTPAAPLHSGGVTEPHLMAARSKQHRGKGGATGWEV